MEKDLTKLTVRQLADGMARRVFSSEEVTAATLAAIRQRDPEIGAYLTGLEEDALAAADSDELDGFDFRWYELDLLRLPFYIWERLGAAD